MNNVISLQKYKTYSRYRSDINFFNTLIAQMSDTDLDLRADLIINEIRGNLAQRELSLFKFRILYREYTKRNLKRVDYLTKIAILYVPDVL